MKKAYSKPDINFEDFSLSTNIAAGCEVKTNTSAQAQCGLAFDDTVVFTGAVLECRQHTVVEDGSPLLNGLCYHVPYSTNNLFNS